MNLRRECRTCAHWEQMTAQRGYCPLTPVEQGPRVGWLITRRDDWCGRPAEIVAPSVERVAQ